MTAARRNAILSFIIGVGLVFATCWSWVLGQ